MGGGGGKLEKEINILRKEYELTVVEEGGWAYVKLKEKMVGFLFCLYSILEKQ